MKNKSLLLGLAALLTFAISFSGCDNPINTETIMDSPLVKLADPVVRVMSYEGFNVVSWSPVPDAKSYDVWRLDMESKTQVHLHGTTTAAGDLSYVDDVSNPGNPTAGSTTSVTPLVNEREYEYTVIAIPTGINTTGVTTPLSAKENIYSGKGSSELVAAQVPDRMTYKVAKVSNLQTKVVDGKLSVSFKLPENAVAAVTYTYDTTPTGAAGLGGDMDSNFTATTDAGYLYPNGYTQSDFPVIGGKATVVVQTSYSPTTSSASSYYDVDTPDTKTFDVDKYEIGLLWPSSASINAVYLPNTTAIDSSSYLPSGTVRLSFPGIVGATEFGVTYKVYKAEVGTLGTKYATTAEWKVVEGTQVISPVSGVVTIDETSTAWAGTNKVKYMVIAETMNEDKKVQSKPIIGDLTSAIALTSSSLSANVVDVTGRKVNLSWTEEPGVKYVLYRALINEAEQETSSYESIFDSTATASNGGTLVNNDRIFIDTLPKYRQSYKYRLVAEKDTIKSEATTKIDTAPFSKTLVAPSTGITAGLSANASSINVYGIQVNVDITGGYTDDLTAHVYKRVSSAPTLWSDAGTITGTNFGQNAAGVEVLGLVPGTSYDFKVEFTSSDQGTTKLLLKTDTTATWTGTTSPATADSALQSALSGTTFTTGNASPATNAAKIAINFGSSTTPSLLKGANLYAKEVVAGSAVGDKISLTPTISVQTTVRNQSATLGNLSANSLYYDLAVNALNRVGTYSATNNVRTYRIFTEGSSGDDSSSYLVVTVTSTSATSVTTKIQNGSSGSNSETVTFNW
jgi:hypothetical protein